jgi:hypothetical protein
MKNNLLIGVVTSFVLVSNVYAANKTHITDSIGEGNSQASISISTGNLKATGNLVLGGSTIPVDIKNVGFSVGAAYTFGITDRLDFGISFPLSNTKTIVADYAFGTNSYTNTNRYEGQGDPSVGANYLILDKKQDRVSWNIKGKFSPSVAASDAGVTEVKTNGSVTTSGTATKSGKGYTTTSISSALSIPTGAGDLFLAVTYSEFGEKIKSGVKSKNGSDTSIMLGIESLVSDRTTLTPYGRYILTASGYDGTSNSSASSSFDVGLALTNDISKNLSIGILAEYNVINEVAVNYANGDKFSFKGNGYTLNLTTMFFF